MAESRASLGIANGLTSTSESIRQESNIANTANMINTANTASKGNEINK